jgi:PAS domain S-box-containing protein
MSLAPRRLAVYVILPVVLIGFALAVVSVESLTPWLYSYFDRRNGTQLKLASLLALEVCEQNLQELIELRLEDDPEMNETMLTDALRRVEDVGDRFEHVGVYVVDLGGKVIASSDGGSLGRPEVEPFPKGRLDIREMSFLGQASFVHGRYFPFWRWHVVAAMPKEKAYAPVYLARTVTYAVLAGTAAALIAVVFVVFHGQVTRPLSLLAGASAAVSEGRYETLPTSRRDEIGALIRAFNSMVGDLETSRREVDDMVRQLQQSEQRFRAIVENTSAGYFSAGPDGCIRDANEAWLRMHRYRDRSEAIGKQMACMQEDGGKDDMLSRVLAGETVSSGHCTVTRADGTVGHHTVSIVPVRTGNRVVGVEGFVIDTTEREEFREQLAASLKEKEVLLQEVHHRVRNNLNIVVSLLNLRSQTVANAEDAARAFAETRRRIMAMAMIHGRLYESGDFSHVEIGEYVRDFARELAQTYEHHAPVELSVSVNDGSVSLNRAIPLALILNEALTNCYKHAFPRGVAGRIEVSFSELPGNRRRLLVRDNGVGIESASMTEEADSLGTTLMHALAEQLHGSLAFEQDGGTVVRLEFPAD